MHRLPLKPLEGLHVLERGWLSSNNIVLLGADADEGATLVDSGHVSHAEQTLALVRQVLAAHAQPLRALINTHLHSDHCGGNAALQLAFEGLPAHVPTGSLAVVNAWDEDALSYRATGQRCPRFRADAGLDAGSVLAVGGRRWDVIAAAGHDPDALMLFDADAGVLISADALWQNGFGVVFPELEGERAFEDAGSALTTIEHLRPAWVIPGHGAPFDDVPQALARARSRLHSWQSDPFRHARHAARVLIKFHLMEVRELTWAEALAWAESTPLMAQAWRRAGQREDTRLRDWAARLMTELVASGALVRQDDRVCDT